MEGFIDIGGHRFSRGKGLVNMELVEEYGFVASSISFEVDMAALMGTAPDVLGYKREDKIPVVAFMHFSNGIKKFLGLLGSVDGSLEQYEAPQHTVSLEANSVLSEILDSTETITRSYENEDWSRIVAEVATKVGFTTDYVESSGVMAGEKVGRNLTLFNADEMTYSDLISEAISATGFIANVTAEKQFIFSQTYPTMFMPPASLAFRPENEESDIASAPFENGAITSIVLRKNPLAVDPGTALHIHPSGAPKLGGRYYVTQARHSLSEEEEADLVEFSVERELPSLKDEEG